MGGGEPHVQGMRNRSRGTTRDRDSHGPVLWLRLTKRNVYATIGSSMLTEQRLSRNSLASSQTEDMRAERKTLADAGSSKSAQLVRHGGTTQAMMPSWRRRRKYADATDVFRT